MNEHFCWRCGRSLNVEAAPVKEPVKLRCQRCKAPNVVVKGQPATQPLDNCVRQPQHSYITA